MCNRSDWMSGQQQHHNHFFSLLFSLGAFGSDFECHAKNQAAKQNDLNHCSQNWLNVCGGLHSCWLNLEHNRKIIIICMRDAHLFVFASSIDRSISTQCHCTCNSFIYFHAWLIWIALNTNRCEEHRAAVLKPINRRAPAEYSIYLIYSKFARKEQRDFGI